MVEGGLGAPGLASWAWLWGRTPASLACGVGHARPRVPLSDSKSLVFAAWEDGDPGGDRAQASHAGRSLGYRFGSDPLSVPVTPMGPFSLPGLGPPPSVLLWPPKDVTLGPLGPLLFGKLVGQLPLTAGLPVGPPLDADLLSPAPI